MDNFTFFGEWHRHVAILGNSTYRYNAGFASWQSGKVSPTFTTKNDNSIVCTVKGKSEYSTTLKFVPFSLKEKSLIAKTHKALSDGKDKIPADKFTAVLIEKISDQPISFFPNSKTVECQCNCPDSSNPCLHSVAALLSLGKYFEKNPTVFLDIRGFNLNKIPAVEETQISSAVVLEDLELPTFDEFFAMFPLNEHARYNPNDVYINMKPVVLNLPKLWNSYDYSKFLTAFENLYDNIEGLLDRWDWTPMRAQSYLNRYGECLDVKAHLNLNEDGSFALRGGLNQIVKAGYKNKQVHENIIHFFTRKPESIEYTGELDFLYKLFMFACQLIRQKSIIPVIFRVEKSNGNTTKELNYSIRWLPATSNPKILSAMQYLVHECPNKILTQENKKISKSAQVYLLVCTFIRWGIFFSENNGDSYSSLMHRYRSFEPKTSELKSMLFHFARWLTLLKPLSNWERLGLRIDKSASDIEFKLQLIAKNQNEEFVDFQLVENAQTTYVNHLKQLYEIMPQLKNTARPIHIVEFLPIFTEIIPQLQALGMAVSLPLSLQNLLELKMHYQLENKKAIGTVKESFLNLEELCAFSAKVIIGNKAYNSAEFQKLLKDSRGLVVQENGFIILNADQIESIQAQFAKVPKKMNQSDLVYTILKKEFDNCEVELSENLKNISNELATIDAIPTPKLLNAELRPYQLRGFQWLWQNMRFGFSSILADDMGLGKTLQVIALIAYIVENSTDKQEKFLIIAPTSILTNWGREIEKFAPNLEYHIYHGGERALDLQAYQIVITSYGLARNDNEELKQIPWHFIIADEAQNLKNPDALQTRAVKSLKSNYRIAMSGTPVENRLMEYYSIFDFVQKNYLGTQSEFIKKCAIPIEKHQDEWALNRFRTITAPFILRRVKTDKNIISDLPEKFESNKICLLTKKQAALYQTVTQEALQKIHDLRGIARRGLVLQLITSLKQICNHPAQFTPQEKIKSDHSGKTQLLLEILNEIQETGEKCIIFTQYAEMGIIIQKILKKEAKLEAPFFHGGLSRNDRDKMVAHFQDDPNCRVMILSLKAGGVGLNLTKAQHVIHFDLWWNPAVESQATDRAFRIGQTKNVLVHRLITDGTFETRIDQMLQDKKHLANLTLKSGDKFITEYSNEELNELLALRGY